MTSNAITDQLHEQDLEMLVIARGFSRVHAQLQHFQILRVQLLRNCIRSHVIYH